MNILNLRDKNTIKDILNKCIEACKRTGSYFEDGPESQVCDETDAFIHPDWPSEVKNILDNFNLLCNKQIFTFGALSIIDVDESSNIIIECLNKISNIDQSILYQITSSYKLL